MNSTIKPSDEELNELFSLANKVPFDDRVNHQAELSDLNITLIKSYLHELGRALESEVDLMKFEELCMNMELCSSQPEFMKPRNVALLFFCMNPEKFMPYSQIDVVEFHEGVGGDKIIEKILRLIPFFKHKQSIRTYKKENLSIRIFFFQIIKQ